MIRINLLGGKAKPRKTAGGAQFIAYLGFIAIVFGGLYLWHQQQVDQLAAAKKKAVEAADKVDSLKRVKSSWEQWQGKKNAIDAQTKVFESLQADQIGPAMALQYLSYALTRIDDDPVHQEEAKAQELAGWNPKWDTHRVWLKSIEVKKAQEGKPTTVEIKGEALDHQDVAEFYRRLESSDIFIGLGSPSQRRRVHEELNIKYIDFQVSATLSYVAVANAWKEAEAEAVKAAEPVAEPATAAATAVNPPPGTAKDQPVVPATAAAVSPAGAEEAKK